MKVVQKSKYLMFGYMTTTAISNLDKKLYNAIEELRAQRSASRKFTSRQSIEQFGELVEEIIYEGLAHLNPRLAKK